MDKINAKQKDQDWSIVDLYVTVEPCVMCTAALRILGVRKAYFGTYNERFGGCGSVLSAHDQHMPEETEKLNVNRLEEWRKPCVLALRKFYLRRNERAPKPKNKQHRILKEDV